MNRKESLFLFLRYILIFILGLNIYVIYDIFTPITSYFSFFVLNLFYSEVSLQGTSIILKENILQLIPACIAGSAYYLLFMLNLSTPMSLLIRIKSLLFIFLSFLFINILRIFIFSSLFVSGFKYFSLAHQITWYLGSTILVVLIWFANVKLFSIKSIPVLADFFSLYIDTKSKTKKI